MPPRYQPHQPIDAKPLARNDRLRAYSSRFWLCGHRVVRRQQEETSASSSALPPHRRASQAARSVSSESRMASWEIGWTWWMEGTARTFH
jgi:hypothetical protein